MGVDAAPHSRPRLRLRYVAGAVVAIVVVAIALFMAWSSLLVYQAHRDGVGIGGAATRHLAIVVHDPQLPRIDGTALRAVGLPSDHVFALYVAPGSTSDKALHAIAYGPLSSHPQATLMLDGKTVASGYVAADDNVVDSEGGPIPGQTGFFSPGYGSRALFQRVLALSW